MTSLFKKLNLGKVDVMHVLNAPASFEIALQQLSGVEVRRQATGVIQFALAFVKTAQDVEQAVDALTRSAAPDALLWMAYPKRSSRQYQCEFHRDTGWSRLGQAGYEPVRQVAIDEDWSALRFRKAEFIRVMQRDPARALSDVGRQRARRHRQA